MKKSLVIINSILMCILFCVITEGGIITQDTWEVTGDLMNWTNKGTDGGPGYGTLAQATLGGRGALRITRSGFGEDFVYTAKPGMTGNWTAMGVRAISFDFYANAGGSTELPAALELYFLHNTYTWRLTIDVSSLSQGWNNLIVRDLIYEVGWYSPENPSAGASQFYADLADVDEVGIMLTYQTWAGQIYGLDNFTLWDIYSYLIPEPQTWAVLAFTFLSLGLILRKEKSLVHVFSELRDKLRIS